MTVNLTRIYTKLGDAGETHLGDMSRVSKQHPRVEAYGTLDELNATLGVALLAPGMPDTFATWLQRVQNDLLDLGADLSVPAPAPEDGESPEQARQRLRVTPQYTEWLEQACDEVNATLAPLRSFVIPGGTPAAAQLHLCRTVCRRAERRALAVDDGNPEVLRYLNRLSDLLFILARAANGDSSEPLWDPGAHSAGASRSLAQLRRRAAGASATPWVGGAQRHERQRHPQRAEQIAADHVAWHVPGEDQQRAADRHGEHVRRSPRPTVAGGAVRRAPRTARAPSRQSRDRSATRPRPRRSRRSGRVNGPAAA